MVPGGLVILSDRESIGRLRRDSGCRRLAPGSDARFVAIEDVPDGDGTVPFDVRQDWSSRLGIALGPAAPPVVMVWRQGAPSSGASPRAMLERLRRFVDRAVQADRSFLHPAAVIAVFPDGIRPSHCDDLEALAEDHAVYLMSSQTRVLPSGVAHRSAEVWPVPVGRLIGSLMMEPRRQRGLRAWRALGVLGAGGEEDSLDVAASKLARQVISGIDEAGAGAPVSATTAEADVRPVPLDPPDDRVAVDGVPQHAADGERGAGARRPELPGWWELVPADGESPVRGSARFEAESRLRVGPGSAWRRAFSRRGAAFVRDRFARAKLSAAAILGPHSAHSTAWARIHSSPAFVGWHAKGAFYRRPDGSMVEVMASQRLAWSRLREADDRAATATVRARLTAHELGVARSCSPSLLARTLCFLAAALFASSVVGVVAASFRGADGLKWSMITGAAACAAGLASAGFLMYMEWRAGEAGRAVVESDIRRAEASISDTFHARLELGAAAELMQRRVAWLQSAARIRETADRLHVVMGMQERAHLRDEAGGEAPGAHSLACLDFRGATSTCLEPPITAESVVSALRKGSPLLVERERSDFLRWWRDCLRRLDPSFAGGIVSTEFGRAYAERLASITAVMRAALRDELGRIPHAAWSGTRAAGLARSFGTGDDVPGLSCVTHRAKGLERHRVVWVLAPTEGAGRAISDALRQALHGDVAPMVVASDTDGWGGLLLVVDELTVSLDRDSIGVDGGVRVMEGRRRAG